MTIHADRNGISRVFSNLINNSIKFIPQKDGGVISILVEPKQADRDTKGSKGTIVVSIKDNGEGIDPERYNSIFQPNFTTKTGGTGLGLSMVKNIIKSMNGEIYFESELGTGTTFFIKLPKREVSPHS